MIGPTLLDSYASWKLSNRWGKSDRAFKNNYTPNEIRKLSVMNCSILANYVSWRKVKRFSELHYSRSISLVQTQTGFYQGPILPWLYYMIQAVCKVPWITPARKNMCGRPPAFLHCSEFDNEMSIFCLPTEGNRQRIDGSNAWSFQVSLVPLAVDEPVVLQGVRLPLAAPAPRRPLITSCFSLSGPYDFGLVAICCDLAEMRPIGNVCTPVAIALRLVLGWC